jgi:ribose transport system substrate-binding protein
LQGKGNVVIINGPPVASVVERVQECMSVFSKYPDIKILSKDQNAEGSRDGGLRVMSDLLTSFPKRVLMLETWFRHSQLQNSSKLK